MNREEYLTMFRLEERHWYFRGKRRLVADLLATYSSGDCGRVLDAGCGTGGNLEMLSRFGRVFGLEPFRDAAGFSAGRGGASVVRGAAQELPFADGVFDLVTSLDVIEHIEDDVGALRELWRALRPGGVVLLTVPAFMFLWSGHDDALHHKRRYRRDELRQKLAMAGFSVQKCSYFNFFVFPVVALLRLARRRNGEAAAADTAGLPLAPINRFMYGIARLESWLTGMIDLPFGVSMVCVAKKKV